MAERDIQQDIRLALGSDPRCCFWRNSVGVAEADGRKQRFGLCVGSADLVGIVNGRFAALEIKTRTGRTSPEQERFMTLVRNRGGFAAVVRSVDEARAAVDRAAAGELQ